MYYNNLKTATARSVLINTILTSTYYLHMAIHVKGYFLKNKSFGFITVLLRTWGVALPFNFGT